MQVKLIRSDGTAALVEWLDQSGVHRVTVPASAIKKGECPLDELARGIPYGLPWESLIELQANSCDLANNLRQRGIWTAEDLRSKPEVARGALMETYGVDFSTLLRAAGGKK